MVAAARGVVVTAALFVAAGCAQCCLERTCRGPTVPQESDYGPNPLADCLHWPADAPRLLPLYAP